MWVQYIVPFDSVAHEYGQGPCPNGRADVARTVKLVFQALHARVVARLVAVDARRRAGALGRRRQWQQPAALALHRADRRTHWQHCVPSAHNWPTLGELCMTAAQRRQARWKSVPPTGSGSPSGSGLPSGVTDSTVNGSCARSAEDDALGAAITCASRLGWWWWWLYVGGCDAKGSGCCFHGLGGPRQSSGSSRRRWSQPPVSRGRL